MSAGASSLAHKRRCHPQADSVTHSSARATPAGVASKGQCNSNRQYSSGSAALRTFDALWASTTLRLPTRPGVPMRSGPPMHFGPPLPFDPPMRFGPSMRFGPQMCFKPSVLCGPLRAPASATVDSRGKEQLPFACCSWLERGAAAPSKQDILNAG